ncbi:hypothetical protein ACKUB1_02450 [Methanospirillum stamsii]|uniref:V-type ATP synthase subunit H n=1 Tax=Methanospirillum stamsii TaxID=1277351 RepID=A0A2V2MY64_9EURY|nr:hypothetical protein [Methanospirillum stamsii]PWR72379.1 hypothetical protein DLD82_12380 [Methanospirillum stamsii]
MDLREIDQIKEAEKEAVNLIETARHRMKLAMEEAKREGEERFSVRLSDAETRLRSEREKEEEILRKELLFVMSEAENEVSNLRSKGEKNVNAAVLQVVRIVTGEEDVLSSSNE